MGQVEDQASRLRREWPAITQVIEEDSEAVSLGANLQQINNATFSNDDIVQKKSGVLTNRTLTQLKADLSLENVNNTSDAGKPISTAVQTALNAKAPLNSPEFTGTPTGITKGHVGLGNVDNVSDLNKPVSTATQTALDNKANKHAVVTLTDAANIATNCALGSFFSVTLGGNRTLSNPTNAEDGKSYTWRFIQDGSGNRTIALDSGFSLGTNIQNVDLFGTAGKVGYMTAIYFAADSKMHVVAFEAGA